MISHTSFNSAVDSVKNKLQTVPLPIQVAFSRMLCMKEFSVSVSLGCWEGIHWSV